MHFSLTRQGTNRIEEKPLAAGGPSVAVVAATAAEARAAADVLVPRVPGRDVVPAAFGAYLADAGAPSRVILCATRGPAERAAAFLGRAAARLLWPPPPSDLGAAIGGLRETPPAPARIRRARSDRRRVRSALLLEGSVDRTRAGAALAATKQAERSGAEAGVGMGLWLWIVESPRHVRLPERSLAALARAGVEWSALEPVELVAVYAAPPVARALRGRGGLPRGTPVWITPDRARR